MKCLFNSEAFHQQVVIIAAVFYLVELISVWPLVLYFHDMSHAFHPMIIIFLFEFYIYIVKINPTQIFSWNIPIICSIINVKLSIQGVIIHIHLSNRGLFRQLLPIYNSVFVINPSRRFIIHSSECCVSLGFVWAHQRKFRCRNVKNSRDLPRSIRLLPQEPE